MSSSGPEEVEGAELLDHAYDGIQEYDNPLPAWWVWVFVATIVFTPLYVVHYHFGQGDTVEAEYAADLAAWNAAEAARALESGVVSEETLAALMHDATTLAAGEALFKTNCVVCHGDRAEGKIGPNLTDDFWLHGGTLLAIHRTVDQGVPEKGMLAWGKTLAPDDVRRVAAWVGSLRGKNVPGLPPQGEKLGM
jgi:cytochrome c oxidase cbb3-type subunit III